MDGSSPVDLDIVPPVVVNDLPPTAKHREEFTAQKDRHDMAGFCLAENKIAGATPGMDLDLQGFFHYLFE